MRGKTAMFGKKRSDNVFLHIPFPQRYFMKLSDF